MYIKIIRLLFVTFILLSIANFNPVLAKDFILDDAERFAKLYDSGSIFNEKHINNHYLNIGTEGVEIFTPYRIKNAKNLIKAITESPNAYKKGIDLCLPAAKNNASTVRQVMVDVQTLLGLKESAPAYILFGANNSGGTASKAGLTLGLEVLCRFAETEEEAKEIILTFIAHEIVHVYQSRHRENTVQKTTLLRQALTEGFADFVANLVLGTISQSEIERHNFGIENESVIWAEFKTVMNGEEFKPWMYSSGRTGRPNDLGYWLGKRITQAYYEKAEDKTKALEELLLLKDPQYILTTSGYNPN